MRKNRPPRLGLIAIISGLILVGIATGAVTGQSGCRTVHGTIALAPLTGPGCTSPVGICANLRFGGDLKGDGTLIATSLLPTVDTPTTSVVLLTSQMSIQANGASIAMRNAGSLETIGKGNYVDLAKIVSGTGRWTGATGAIRISGKFVADEGGAAAYKGNLCVV